MDIHERRKKTLLVTGLSVLILITSVFCVINYQRGAVVLSVVELVVSLICAALIFLVKRFPHHLRKASWFFVVFAGIFGLFAFSLPKSHVTIIVWSVLFYFVALFLLELRAGTILSGIFFILTVSLFLSRYSSGPKALPLVALANVIILNFTTAIFTIYYEKTRAETEAALEAKSREIEALSNLDGLTGLFNRRYFDKVLAHECRRLSRDDQPLSLIMADIDFFKKFNDTCGHLKGDDCIREVADSIKSSIGRISDVATRYGGEEFAVILPNTDSPGAMEIARKIKESIHEKAIMHPASEISGMITMSFGISTVTPNHDFSPTALIAQADEALYKSKTDGRNRITLNL